jgi:hypothetical protein
LEFALTSARGVSGRMALVPPIEAQGETSAGFRSILPRCPLDLFRRSFTASNHLAKVLLEPGRRGFCFVASGLAPLLRDSRR